MTDESSRKPSHGRLYLAVVCANIISFSMGTVIAWTSPMIPKLLAKDDTNPIGKPITVYQMSWIFSLLSFGAVISCIFGYFLAKNVGRKHVMWIVIGLYFISIFTMYSARSIERIYMVRVLEGLAVGTTVTVLPIYIGEISTKENRGSCGTMIMVFMTLGQLFDYCVGPFVSFTHFYSAILLAPILAVIGQLFVPESPVYLLMNKRVDDAINSLKILRSGRMDIISREILDIQQDIERTQAMQNQDCGVIFKDRINRKSFTMVIALMLLQMLSGAVIIVINSQIIFQASGFHISGAVSSIIVGAVQVVSSVTLQFIVDHHKRRTLLSISALGMCFSHCIFGTFFLIDKYGNADSIRWSPLTAGILFQIFYRVGFGPLPYAILGEMLSPEVKALAGPSFTLACYGMAVVITFFYPLINELGSYYVFYIFAVNCMIAFCYTQLIVVETLDLTLKEIQAKLS